MLEELGIDYDAHVIDIRKEDQFTTGFTKNNPNGKIPCALDKDGPGGEPIMLFESAAICLYLAEKYNRFLPTDPRLKAEVMQWVFWQMAGQGPMTGNFGHFFVYAPDDKVEARNYGVMRFGMETQRLMSVLDSHLEGKTFMVGEELSIADFIMFPWARHLYTGYIHSTGLSAAEFLTMDQYKNVKAWVDGLSARPAFQRGLQVCHINGQGKPWLTAETSV